MSTGAIFEILHEKCSAFVEDVRKYQEGVLEDKLEYGWAALFVNAGHDDAAREFVKYNPDTSAIEGFEKEIDKIRSKKCQPTLCRTFGCSDEDIKSCHEHITKNSSQEINNSPANHITKSKIKNYLNALQYRDQLDNIFFKLENDFMAHLSAEFLEAAADLKLNNVKDYTKLIEDFKQNNVKIQKFEKEVELIAKKLKQAASKRKDKSSEELLIELPEALQYYNYNLEGSKFFISENGQICYRKEEQEDIKTVIATNFLAKITQSYVFDDGLMQVRKFKIKGLVNATDELPEIIVDAKDFGSLSWILTQWGNRAIIMDEATVKAVREFIQTVSMDAPEIVIHYRLGWKLINNEWCYLYSNGIIGNAENIAAEISEIPNYQFFKNDLDPKEAINVALHLLKLAKPEITYPLVGHAFLSILIEKLSQEQLEPKYLLWMYGQSGSFKTALSILIMNLFGNFTSPPATFSDTINALEKKAYLTKDSLLLIDDFHPSTSPHEARMKTGAAQNLTRKYGDRSSKGRAKSNMSLASEYKPQGNGMGTSEDLLLGHSTNSRHISIAVSRGDIDKEILTELQGKTDYLNKAMQVFIEWCADKIMNNDEFKFKPEFLHYRELAQDTNRHLRFAEAVAHLQIGLTTFLKFAHDNGAITEAECKELSKTSFDVFVELAEKQNELAQSEDVADKFMVTIKELIDSKEIEPADILKPLHLSKASTICYYDSDYYYFIPQSIYAKVAEFLKRKDEMLSITDRMLWKMLRERKYIVTPNISESDSHQFAKKKIGLSQIRVAQIERKKLENF